MGSFTNNTRKQARLARVVMKFSNLPWFFPYRLPSCEMELLKRNNSPGLVILLADMFRISAGVQEKS